jgi:serine/threonine protein kinase
MQTGTLTNKIVGGYQLLRLLGEGAAGSVYHGYKPEQNLHAAIKILSPMTARSQQNSADRFALEAQTIANLRHPHIVPIYEYGNDGHYKFIAMRLLTGGSLEERFFFHLRQDILPSLGEVSQLLHQVSEALMYAHERSIIHRDVKANNIMFDEYGSAYLVDFGVAKLLDGSVSLTASDIILGTPAYMPPEQWRGETLTPATDQYALGVLVYLLVTGQFPFDPQSAHNLMYQHLTDEPPLAHQVRSSLPEAVSTVLLRALAKDPNDRFATVRDFTEAFEEAVRGFEGSPTNYFTRPVERGTVSDTQFDHLQPVRVVTGYSNPEISASNGNAPIQRKPRLNRLSWVLLGAVMGLAVLGLCAASVLFGLNYLLQDDDVQISDIPITTNIPVTQIAQLAPSPTVTLNITLQPTVTSLPLAGTRPANPNTPGVVDREAEPTRRAVAEIDLENVQPQEQQIIQTDNTSTRSVAFNPDGTMLATGGNGQMIQIWNVQTGAEVAALNGHSDVIYTLAYSPDGTRLASGSGDGTVRIWDMTSNRQALTLPGHVGDVRRVVYSPDGRYLVSVGEDRTVRIWDAASGEELQNLPGGDPNSERILGAVFSPDGNQLLTGWNHNEIALWSVPDFQQLQTFIGHTGEVRALEFSPQGSLIASSSTDNTIRLWDVNTGDTEVVIPSQGRDVYDVAFSPDGNILASGSADNNIYLWNAATGEQITDLRGHQGWVFDLEFSRDGSLLASASGDGSVRLWRNGT